MRSLPLARSTQVTNCAAGAAVAGERRTAIKESALVPITTLRTPSERIVEGYLFVAKKQHCNLNIQFNSNFIERC
jgi:hypothetical protein